MKCTDCHRQIRPVVALDLDNTLCDYTGSFLTFAEGWLGVTGTGWALTYDGSVTLAMHMGVSQDTYRAIKLAYRQGGMKRTQPAFDGAEGIVRRCQALGAEVWITTTRPYNRFDSTDPDTREWLRRHSMMYDGLIYDDDKYGMLLSIVGPERVVAVVDDLDTMYDRAADIGLNPIMIARRYNRAVRRPISVSSLAEATDVVSNRIQEWRVQHGH